MSLDQSVSPTTPRWRSYALWAVKALLAAAFLSAGGAKLLGASMMVETFDHIGVGQWFRYLTGLLEILGAAALLLPATSGVAALLLTCVMVGAVVTHVFLIGGSFAPALLLLALNLVVAWNERERIASALETLQSAEA
ncbi:DoxX family protein [Terrarubrum flagellatum]|uniref:DoxX family protein n=1 Tax=Terrirubrum flagellatum TaxID=2895980 RepID=UPI0031455AA0